MCESLAGHIICAARAAVEEIMVAFQVRRINGAVGCICVFRAYATIDSICQAYQGNSNLSKLQDFGYLTAEESVESAYYVDKDLDVISH